MMRRLMFTACLLLALLMPLVSHAQSGGLLELTMTYNDLEREYLLYVPASYDPATLAPLVMVLHGGGGAPRGVMNQTRRDFNDLRMKMAGWWSIRRVSIAVGVLTRCLTAKIATAR